MSSSLKFIATLLSTSALIVALVLLSLPFFGYEIVASKTLSVKQKNKKTNNSPGKTSGKKNVIPPEEKNKNSTITTAPRVIINQELRINDVVWRVMGTPEVSGAEGSAQFIYVELMFRNKGDKATDVDYRQITLIDSDKRRYSPSENDSPYRSDLQPGPANPGARIYGFVSFDVAADASGFELELLDVPSLAKVDKKEDHVGYIELKL